MAQRDGYTHLFNGKLYPSTLLSYAVTAVAFLVVFGVVHYAFKYAQKVSGQRLQDDPLTKRIASDFRVPEKCVAESLVEVAGRDGSITNFTHDGRFHTFKYQTKYDEQLRDYVNYIKVISAPAQGFSRDLIVP
jgi:hypothetical protein